MKLRKMTALVAAMLLAIGATSQTVTDSEYGEIDFGVSGFAAMPGISGTNWYHAGGVTGGAGGEIVTAETFQQLQAYCQSSKPYIILVTKPITTGIKAYVESSATGQLLDDQSGATGEETTYGERILIASNKTVIGAGDDIQISRITFVMQCQSNIIIRNLKFTMKGVPVLKSGENKIVAWRDGAQVEVGDPDIIGIQADKNSAKSDYGSHIWVDHCEFYNGDAANKDRYDGLLDCKNNVQWLTFSWNYFHNHDKSCLWGKGDSDVFDGCRTITCHHNHFSDIDGSRLPLQRGGNVHYYNNMQENCSDGWDLRSKSVGYAEACYFKDSKAPILPDGGGEVNIATAEGYGLIYDNCRRVIVNHAGVSYVNDPAKHDAEYDLTELGAEGTWSPYDIEGYTARVDKTEDVPGIVEKYAGAGKVNIWEQYAETIPAVDEEKYAEALATAETAKTYGEDGTALNSIGGTASSGETGSEEIEGVPYIYAQTTDGGIEMLMMSETEIANRLIESGVVSYDESTTYDGTKDPSNSSVTTTMRGAISIGKETGAATLKLPSCTHLKLTFFRTGSYATDYEVSGDGEIWTKVKSSTDTKGELTVDLTQYAKSESAVYVRIKNTSTGTLHLMGVLAYTKETADEEYGCSSSAAREISSCVSAETIELYDLVGRRVAGGGHGIMIERRTQPNGAVRTRKIAVK